MDLCKEEAEKNNNAGARKPRAREITSRYKAPTPPRRCPSPDNRRAQSAERRRPATPPSPSRPSTPPHDVEMQISSRRLMCGRTHEGLWPSMRSLSVSFQADSFSIPITKREKPITNASSDHALKSSANVTRKHDEIAAVQQRKPTPERKRTPLRGKNVSDQSENSKPVDNLNAKVIDQHRWPSRAGGKLSANMLSRSVDLTDKPTRSVSLPLSRRGISPMRRLLASDGVGRGENEMGLKIPSVNDASRRVELSKVVSSTGGASSDSLERPLLTTRPTRSQSSPMRGLRNPPASNKATRGGPSPSRIRPSSPSSPSSSVSSRSSCSSSVLSFTPDVRKGKKGANQIEDAHQLRLLYNRHLQWCLVNARAEATFSIQKSMAENILYNVWHTTCELRHSVMVRRINLQQLRQEMKLSSILKEQLSFLDDWAQEEREHLICLSGAIGALEASTLHLPVSEGTKADLQMVKDAVSSAVDVMQALGSSIHSLLARVEGMNCLVSELASVAAQERAMVAECVDLLASTAAMKVQEYSLRTHLIQLKQAMLKQKQSILAVQYLI